MLTRPGCIVCGMAEATTTTVHRNGTAIVSATFGIVAFTVGLLLSIPLGIVLAGIGLLFGGLAVSRSREGKSVWVPALIINGVTLLVGLLSYFG